MNSKVSLVRSKDHYTGVQNALELLKEDLEKSLSNISSLLIKINLVITRTPAYTKGVKLATTPVEAVSSFIDFTLPFYNGKIIIAEEATWGDTCEGFQMYGFSTLSKKYPQVELLNLEEDQNVVKRIKYPGGELELPFSKTMLDAPFIVSIARPKTHCTVVMTAGIKNVLVGSIHKYSMRKKIHQGNFIHNLISSIAYLVYPNFTIIDGTIGMEDGGPVRGKEIKSGWTVSSFDSLTVDSLTAYLMGFKIEDIGYLTMLKEKGFGACYPYDKIDVIGEKPKSLLTPFKPHRNFNKIKNWRKHH